MNNTADISENTRTSSTWRAELCPDGKSRLAPQSRGGRRGTPEYTPNGCIAGFLGEANPKSEHLGNINKTSRIFDQMAPRQIRTAKRTQLDRLATKLECARSCLDAPSRPPAGAKRDRRVGISAERERGGSRCAARDARAAGPPKVVLPPGFERALPASEHASEIGREPQARRRLRWSGQ